MSSDSQATSNPHRDPGPDLLAILREDYARFPENQTYSIYDPEVYFKDPVNEFRGLSRYQEMIGWMGRWFQDIRLDLHEIQQTGAQIRTEWTLSWSLPLPWHPRLRIPGWTELHLNEAGLIGSHIDYWRCSRWEVLGQVFRPRDPS